MPCLLPQEWTIFFYPQNCIYSIRSVFSQAFFFLLQTKINKLVHFKSFPVPPITAAQCNLRKCMRSGFVMPCLTAEILSYFCQFTMPLLTLAMIHCHVLLDQMLYKMIVLLLKVHLSPSLMQIKWLAASLNPEPNQDFSVIDKRNAKCRI